MQVDGFRHHTLLLYCAGVVIQYFGIPTNFFIRWLDGRCFLIFFLAGRTDTAISTTDCYFRSRYRTDASSGKYNVSPWPTKVKVQKSYI